ncbi:hypothetical protein [uncultured Jatrophihabitans sp.]|uniref:hypothetical protein n=1 Tax=uncultured Jatrophihabitans sp. TaxID=1610747 RepID=UPI0035CB1276
MAVDTDGLRRVAAECVTLVAAEFGSVLDWRVESLEQLDSVCERLLADGPLDDKRFHLWWQVVGAYVGEVVVRAYGGRWITHADAAGAYAVSVDGSTGFPFAVTQRVLEGEHLKNLASFARVFPHLTDRPAADAPRSTD